MNRKTTAQRTSPARIYQLHVELEEIRPPIWRRLRVADTLIADANLIRSMSRKGCSPDNAGCEGFFGRLKTEMFYSGDWQTASIEQFTQALDWGCGGNLGLPWR